MKTTAADRAFETRVRFNWGYHDAAHDVETQNIRALVVDGPQTPQTVSEAFDLAYARGYALGLEDARAKAYQSTSEPAWQRAVAADPTLPDYVRPQEPRQRRGGAR